MDWHFPPRPYVPARPYAPGRLYAPPSHPYALPPHPYAFPPHPYALPPHLCAPPGYPYAPFPYRGPWQSRTPPNPRAILEQYQQQQRNYQQIPLTSDIQYQQQFVQQQPSMDQLYLTYSQLSEAGFCPDLV
ncbi:hypothetical protein OSTOST_02441 [Ostertagia ostertagi]